MSACPSSSDILSRLIELCRLLAVIPPGIGDATTIAWLGRRSPEHVPVGDPVRRLVPCRNPIAPSAEYAIERAAGDMQIGAGLRGDDLVEQGIDHGVSDAGHIAGALGRRCL